MESAAVARAAQCHGIPFFALKVISDAQDFEMPQMDRFVTHEGRFRSRQFLFFALFRPWLWPSVFRLAKNSKKAANALSKALDQYNQEVEISQSQPDGHPSTVSR